MTVVWILLSAAALFCATRLIELEEDVTSYGMGLSDDVRKSVDAALAMLSDEK